MFVFDVEFQRSFAENPVVIPVVATDAVQATKLAVKVNSKQVQERRTSVKSDRNLSPNKVEEILAGTVYQEYTLADVTRVSKQLRVEVAD